MQTIEEHAFWCWKPKLTGVIYLLYSLAGRDFSQADAEDLAGELRNTNADKGDWLIRNISIAPGIWQVAIAIDEDDRDIVSIKIKAPSEFQERIRFLDQIQSSLKAVEPDFK